MAFVAILLVIFALFRIVSTYSVFNNTIDEPINIRNSICYWSPGAKCSDPISLPVGHLFVGIGPIIDGARAKVIPYKSEQDFLELSSAETDVMLYENNRYWTRVMYARIGTLPFFLLACSIVWLWGKKLGGSLSGLVAVFFLSMTPVVIGHSGMATTDVAHLAMFGSAVLAFVCWLENPSWKQTVFFGIVTGLAVITKASLILFLPLTTVIIALVRFYMLRPSQVNFYWLLAVKKFAIIVLVAFVTAWGTYHFEVGPIVGIVGPDARPPFKQVDKYFGHSGLAHDIANAIVLTPVPMPSYFQGLHKLLAKTQGEARYFLGHQLFNKGDWRFFPTAFIVKTPICLLLLLAIGIVACINDGLRSKKWQLITPLIASFLMFGFAMSSNINMGLRHILPVYLFAAVIAGYGGKYVWEGRRHRWLRVIFPLLILGVFMESMSAKADLIEYFNVLASNKPENILIESDLDWGQDLERLALELQRREIKEPIYLAFWGTALPSQLGIQQIPTVSKKPQVSLSPNESVSGYVAISIMYLKGYQGYEWLNKYEPIAHVGKSMLLYWIPPKS